MIFQETFDYLFGQLAGAYDKNAVRRLKDYQRKRLRRAQIGLSIKPYYIQASWTNPTGAAGSESVASTQAVTKDLWVLDGALRMTSTNSFALDNNNFELWIRRTAGDSRVQPSKLYIKDEHMLAPSQAAWRPISDTVKGQGALWPFTWPVPIHLMPNELLQIKARVLVGGTPAGRATFAQFRAISVDNNAEDDSLIAELRGYIASHPTQRPIYLSLATPGAKSIVFPAIGTNQKTTAKTREAEDHLLVLGYSMLLARNENGGSPAGLKWRLTSSDGYSFSKEEIDCNCFAFAGPGFFYQAFPQPFLLKKGSSLAASFSTLTALANAQEATDNYVFFRCVTL